MKKWVIHIVLWFLKGDLTLHERNLLSRGILDTLNVLPIADIITLKEDGRWFIQGRPATFEEMKALRESARSALDNFAGKFIDQQVLFAAVTTGVHKATDENAMIFSRAAIWYAQQRRGLLELLAAEGSTIPE